MFTGLISAVGEVVERDGSRFRLLCDYPAESLSDGASVACDGCCLTVSDIAADDRGTHFAVDVSNETLSRTTLGAWEPGRRVNLERAMRLGDELGGHMVSGHVDAVARLTERRHDGESVRFVLETPVGLAPFLASKGSVALDGVSLTVNESGTATFGVNVVPFTLNHTTWRDRRPGDLVNLEVDLLARYVQRMLSEDNQP
jgi:riboflavin synthase